MKPTRFQILLLADLEAAGMTGQGWVLYSHLRQIKGHAASTIEACRRRGWTEEFEPHPGERLQCRLAPVGHKVLNTWRDTQTKRLRK